MATCNICIKRVLNHSYHLNCDICKGIVHLNCMPCVNKNDPLYTHRDERIFYCSLCLLDIFAYNRLDDEDFIDALAESWENQPLISFETLENQELIFSPFDFNDNFDTPLHDVDPDIQFYNKHYSGSLQDCDYYLENMFNEKIKKCKISNQSFSVLHMNIRSMQKNLGSLENYLEALDHNFTAIGISESWLKEYNVDRHVLDGYKAVHKYRPLRSGGGVSIFIQESLEYFTREDLCHQNNSIESVFIEIDKTQLGKDKNVIIGVVYRPPNGDIDLFNTYMSELLSKIKSERKYVSCLGDYNISLLNYDTHGPTQEFADLMYSHSLFPCITKPTRVTAKSASLIDNIFCNNDLNDDNGFTGILYTDISDHFPIFHIDSSCATKTTCSYFKKRTFSQQNIEQFSSNLRNRNWSDLLSYNDPNFAYNVFSNSITELFDTCFPLRTVKRGYKTRKPWLSEGLKRSIRRKNKLYHRKQKSKKAEDELLYKQYRNKLSRLLHISEQQHYDDLLKENKNNLKISWRIMKDIISKNKTSSSCSRFYINDDGTITNDKKVIAEKFNSFFINVGPNLAKKIPPNSQSPTGFMIRNINSMAVLPVSQSEVSDIINNLKSSSPGWDSISANVVKATYPHFIEPLTHIMNLSITRGIFPKQLK